MSWSVLSLNRERLTETKVFGMCRDVRAAVDLCHRDGSLKRAVAENPAKYIHEVHLQPISQLLTRLPFNDCNSADESAHKSSPLLMSHT